MISGMITATALVGGIGLFIGLFLGGAAIWLRVQTNEKEEVVLELLPGNNCGGCGYPGCAGLAAAIAAGEAPTNACPVGGAEVGKKIAAVMGVEAEESERMVAFVQCRGTRDQVKLDYEYDGIQDCRMLSFVPNGGAKSCNFGCLGYMRDDQVYFLSKTDKPHTADSIFAQAELRTLPKVAIAYYHCGADRQTLELLSERCDGLVIAGSGSGNYSSEWKETIHRLAETKIIVRSSRVLQGIVFDSPFFDPGHDTIPSYTLSPQKARILLMLALSVTGEREQIRTIFETY